MRVTISDVADMRESVMASGLKVWMEGMGVTVDAAIPPMAANLSTQPPTGPALAAPVAVVPPAPRKYTKRAEPEGEKAKLPKAAITKHPAEEGEPHITIRQRVLNCLNEKPKSASELKAELLRTGAIADTVDVGQHLYLAKRDGLVKMDDGMRYRIA